MKKRLILSLLCLVPSLVIAGINENLQNFYTRMGGSVNATPGGAYQSQLSGHYTLGSVTTRSHANTLSFASATAPSLRGGCGGIDLHMGSFSFIRSIQLKRMLQDITTSGANYAFMIGFEQLCPMCKKTMDQLNKLAQEINQWNMSSCSTAASVMGGMLPKTQAVQNYVCTNYAANSGVLADYAAAKQGCGSEGRSNEILQHARTNTSAHAIAWSDVITDKGNLAWLILKRQAIFLDASGASKSGNSTELNELMMTLSGSVILTPGNNTSSTWRWLPSKASDQNLVQALLYGGTAHPAKIYQCNDFEEYGCLAPNYNKTIIIPEASSFVGRVKLLLQSIKRKLRAAEEEDFTPAEIHLINKTKSVPLVKAINVQSAYSFASEIIAIEDYAELIARDLLEDYLMELLDLVKLGSQKIILDEAKMRQFMRGIREAQDTLSYLKMRDVKNFNQALDLVQRIQFLEKMLAGEFSADMARTLDWAVGRR